ncbi:hypothetical protein GCM10023214_44140 [Amycolatopsis dongchuanensis]|uniref:Uncharacterized protein n=1 Tax=Amycolatopsis dongchuanensis TaxID=1070866 RepID=A0ABP9QVV0_9PSEU
MASQVRRCRPRWWVPCSTRPAAGRTSPPRLVGLAYFGFGDVERPRAAVRLLLLQEFQDLGADDLVFLPAESGIDAATQRRRRRAGSSTDGGAHRGHDLACRPGAGTLGILRAVRDR